MAKISYTKKNQPSFGEKRPKLTYNKISRFTVVILYNANVVKLGPKSHYTKNILKCWARLLSYIYIYWLVKLCFYIAKLVWMGNIEQCTDCVARITMRGNRNKFKQNMLVKKITHAHTHTHMFWKFKSKVLDIMG
jgi:hypothetical protein